MLADVLPCDPLHHLPCLCRTSTLPKPCLCFWKLSTYITFPARSALLRPFSSHSPPASGHHAPKPEYGPAILVSDCLLWLRHSALLGDRRQRFFFADLGRVLSFSSLPVCLRKPVRLYGYTFWRPHQSWARVVVVSTLKIVSLTALPTSNLIIIIIVCGASKLVEQFATTSVTATTAPTQALPLRNPSLPVICTLLYLPFLRYE